MRQLATTLCTMFLKWPVWLQSTYDAAKGIMHFWYFDKGFNNISLLHLLAKTNSLYIPLCTEITLTHIEFYSRTRGSFMKVTVSIGSLRRYSVSVLIVSYGAPSWYWICPNSICPFLRGREINSINNSWSKYASFYIHNGSEWNWAWQVYHKGTT
jgi:hypothetical protein